MLRYGNIGHQWQFNEKQKELLKQYYAANQLLVDCLKVPCEITPTVREQILETLLLPITRTSGGASDTRVYLATGNVVKLW
jgi:hypothetical protein